MQESNPHSKTDDYIEIGASLLTTGATETLASVHELITGKFVQDRQLNKTTIAVLKPNEKIQSPKYMAKNTPRVWVIALMA